MTEPVIARRCPSCGVSIREAALFCPQCGKPLAQQEAGKPKPQISPDETISEHATTLGDTVGDPAGEERNASPEQSKKESRKIARQKSQQDSGGNAGAPRMAKASMGKARDAVGARIQRATTMARDVEGDVKDRARKVRDISSVVLDEAGYDPSLRFVLVAGVLFLLFLIIVLLNKFIS